jgi:hypothetical protein
MQSRSLLLPSTIFSLASFIACQIESSATEPSGISNQSMASGKAPNDGKVMMRSLAESANGLGDSTMTAKPALRNRFARPFGPLLILLLGLFSTGFSFLAAAQTTAQTVALTTTLAP